MRSRSNSKVAFLMIACAAIAFVAAGFRTGAPGTDLGTANDPVAPAPHDLATPESAVRSYLDWVSFSYRMANSEIPTATMTPEEGVRVDAYIQLNRMQGRGIDQKLVSFEVRSVSEGATNALLAVTETWQYRYFSLETLEYLTGVLSASYETTYTLVRSEAGWLVDSVEATPGGEVP